MNELYNSFQKYFEIVRADTAELLEVVYRLRYKVFCIEHGFLEASSYPNGIEKDEYDDHSSHALLRFRSSGDYIGSARLILFNPKQPEKPFPVELYTQIDPALCNIKDLPRQQIAEISRFVIVSKFQRRKEDRLNNDGGGRRKNNNVCPATKERRSADRRDHRVTPPLALLLAAGIIRLSVEQNINNWLSVMDPALNRLLGYYGLELNPIGPLVDYHGLRRPYFGKVLDVLDRMYKEHHDAWEVVTDCGKYSPIC